MCPEESPTPEKLIQNTNIALKLMSKIHLISIFRDTHIKFLKGLSKEKNINPSTRLCQCLVKNPEPIPNYTHT